MSEGLIEFALVGDDIMIVRVKGRGCMSNSAELYKSAQKIREQHPNVHIIFDLENCTTVDSSFMGTMVALSQEQKKTDSQYVTVLNLQKRVREVLENTGFNNILDIRKKEDIPSLENADFKKMDNSEPISKIDQIVNVLEAHKTLINLDSENELRFQSVVKYLEDSLEREKKGASGKTPPSNNS